MEVYQHCIFVCSNYTNKSRYGLHFLFNDSNYDKIIEISKKYIEKEGVSMYVVTTNGSGIDSVKQKDKFFETINIFEGTEKESAEKFNALIENQIGVFDIAFLLLLKQKLTIRALKVFLFLIFSIITITERRFIFKEKIYVDFSTIGFKKIDNEFRNYDQNKIIECTKPDIIYSKFFNSPDGTLLMNKVLLVFSNIKTKNFLKLEKIMNDFANQIRQKYKRTISNKGAITLNKDKICKNKFLFDELL